MNTVSIGYYRDDGDFAILATLNNNDGHGTESEFEAMCASVRLMWQGLFGTDEDIIVLEREDTPDYVTIEGDAS